MLKIMLLDDDKVLNSLIKRNLEKSYSVSSFYDVDSALQSLSVEKYDVVISDMMLPDGSGLDILNKTKRLLPDAFIILMTGYADISDAVSAIKQGAMDYLVKPVTYDALDAKLRLVEENTRLRRLVNESNTLPEGNSKCYNDMLHLALRVAASDTTALITGETGSGKSVIAKYIHNNSVRANKFFMKINCANFQENIFESELFGYKKGAFTGAITNKEGIASLADKGTLFFDEIAEIPLNFQAKLLNFLDDKAFLPLGAQEYKKVDVRVIVATNRDIKKMVKEGSFREDLYYRLNVINIDIPPLRKRREDIISLAYHFLSIFRHINPKITDLSEKAAKILEKYDFPGNVRELSNIIERALILERGVSISPSSLNINKHDDNSYNDEPEAIAEMEKMHIIKIYNKYSHDKSKTASSLGIDRTTLYRKLREYNIIE